MEVGRRVGLFFVMVVVASISGSSCSHHTAKSHPSEVDAPDSDDSSHRTAQAPQMADAETPGEPAPEPAPVQMHVNPGPVKPPAPGDPKVCEKLAEKYSTSSPEEMQAAYDSLAEVFDAHRNQRMHDKNQVASQAELKSLQDELGWLAQHAAK